MNKRLHNLLSRFSTLLTVVTALSAIPVHAEKFVAGNVLVVFQNETEELNATIKIKSHGNLKSKPKLSKLYGKTIYLAKIPRGQEVATARRLNGAAKRLTGLASSEIEQKLPLALTPNDPHFATLQSGLRRIQAAPAWDITMGDPSVIIAILDTGTDSSHPDLKSQIVPGWNMYNNNADSSDVQGHGTGTAGTAAATMNNGVGVSGVANVGILPIRVGDERGWASFSTLASGLNYAQSRGARIANMSYSASDSSSVQSAAKSYQAWGGVLTISAGNSGVRSTSSPNPYFLTVSATDPSDAFASWSNYGTNIAVSAPGSGIYSTAMGGGYSGFSGTSFSAPLTAGVAALVASVNPQLTGAQIRKIILDSADDLGTPGYDERYGHGRINAFRAVTMAGGTSVDTTAPKVSISAPADGATVAGTITVSAPATDNVQVASVALYVDGSLKSTTSNANATFGLDTRALSNGSHSLLALATDMSRNSSSSEISVNVQNLIDTTAPSALITSPQNGTVISRTISVRGNYSDDLQVTKVNLFVDGSLVGSSTSSPFSISYNTKRLKAGSHTLQTKAHDDAGNIGSSQIVTVTK